MGLANVVEEAEEILDKASITQLLPRPAGSFGDKNIIEELNLLTQSANGITDMLGGVSQLHGPWTGGSEALSGFLSKISDSNEALSDIKGGVDRATDLLLNTLDTADNLVGQINSVANQFGGSAETQEASNQVSGVLDSVAGIAQQLGSISMGSMNSSTIRGYTQQIKFLPDAVVDFIESNLGDYPYFQEVSENIGGIYYNLVMADNAIDLIQQVRTGGVRELDTNSILRRDTWTKVFPQIGEQLDGAVSKIDNLFVRSLPDQCFGKIITEYQEPIAHGYNLCNDVLQAKRIVETKEKVLSKLVGNFQDVIRRLDGFFPVLAQAKFDKETIDIEVGGSSITVDELGNKIPTQKPQDFRNMGGSTQALYTY